MIALTHRCPVRGCEVQVVNSKLMCSRHWGRVSAATAREVYAAYREAKLSRRHADAMAQAIREASGEAPLHEMRVRREREVSS